MREQMESVEERQDCAKKESYVLYEPAITMVRYTKV